MPTVSIPGSVALTRFPLLRHLSVLGFIALLAFAPLISLFIASATAEKYGCRLDEGGVYPCVIGGTDWGETLSTMSVLGWLMLFTLPIGALLFYAWLVVMMFHWLNWTKKRKATLALATAVCVSAICGWTAHAEPPAAAPTESRPTTNMITPKERSK